MKRETFTVDAPCKRLDLFLAGRLTRLSRSHIKKLISQGAVFVEGRHAEADMHLRAGETVTVASLQPQWQQPYGKFSDWIIHEDRDLLVLNKPAGLLMHPLGTSWLAFPEAALAEPDPNLAGVLLRERPGIGAAGTPRCGIVHRLDRATSGVLLVAKTPTSYERMIQAFKDRDVSKTYRAVVRSAWRERRASVEAPVGRKPGHRQVLATPFGKDASTGFSILESCDAGALVEARPLTGRTHQIRVHLNLLGHPVMGDPEFDRPQAGAPLPPRLMLHAYRVEFAHPATQKPERFIARIPKDMRDFWTRCQAGH